MKATFDAQSIAKSSLVADHGIHIDAIVPSSKLLQQIFLPSVMMQLHLFHFHHLGRLQHNLHRGVVSRV